MVRRLLLWLVATALLGAVAWTGLWHVAAARLETGVAAWSAARRAEGWEIAHGAVKATGYPLRLGVVVAAPRVGRPPAADGRPGWRWRGSALTVAAHPWDLRHVRLEAPGPSRAALVAPGGAEPAAAAIDGLAGEAELDESRRAIAELRLAVPAAQLSALGRPVGRAERVELALGRPQDLGETATLRERASLVVGVAIARLALAAEVRRELRSPLEGPLSLAGDLTVTGTVPPGPPAEAAAAWREAGGTVEVGRLVVEWAPVRVEASGTLALDERLQPEGALVARITGHHELLDLLVGAGAMPEKRAAVAAIVLATLSRPDSEGGPPVIEAPVTAQAGRLFLGPLPLLPLPRIAW